MSSRARILKTSVQLCEPIPWLLEEVGAKATVVAELDESVVVMRMESLAGLQGLQHIRAFSEYCECVLTREGEAYLGYSVREVAQGGDECDVRDGRNLCYGKSQNGSSGFVTLSEDRIKSYSIPEECLSGTGRNGQLYVYFREYLGFDEDGAAYVAAHRMTGLSIVEPTARKQ